MTIEQLKATLEGNTTIKTVGEDGNLLTLWEGNNGLRGVPPEYGAREIVSIWAGAQWGYPEIVIEI